MTSTPIVLIWQRRLSLNAVLPAKISKLSWVCRATQAQEVCTQREAELAEAQAEAQALRDALHAERAASAAAAAALERDLQQRHATERDSALGDANAGFTRRLLEQKQHFEGQLAEQAAKLQVSR